MSIINAKYDNSSESSERKVKREQREIVGILFIGTLLEYFDAYIYLHMALFITQAFFPPEYVGNWFLAHCALCATYFFRPIGSYIIGKIGDIFGRKTTLFFTTIATAVICFITAFLPPYQVIGIMAPIIITICRILQGIASNNELQGAKVYVTEYFKDIRHQCFASGMLSFSCRVGMFLAVGIVAFACYIEKSAMVTNAWRMVFLLGAFIAFAGVYSRRALRESVEFTKSKKILERNIASKAVQDLGNAKVNKMDVFFFFVIRIADGITLVFLPITYCGQLLYSIGVSESEIITQNLLASLVGGISTFITTCLVYVFSPLKIVIFRNSVFLLLAISLPFLIKDVSSKYLIFAIQLCSLIFAVSEAPASPIIFRRFPIFKRSTYVFSITAVGAAVASFILTFPTKFLAQNILAYIIYIYYYFQLVYCL